MLRFFYHPSPNPLKVALFVEEVGLEYELVPVDKLKGDQFLPEFLAVNPNGKVPAILDGDIAVFDSAAILLYLSEKTGRFGATSPAERATMLSWMMFVATGVSPFSGQAVHFRHLATSDVAYAKDRYFKEADRHYRVLDQHLAESRYLAGNAYGIADMALWGWLRYAPFVFGEGGLDPYPHVRRLLYEIDSRPAAARALALGKDHVFKTDLDQEARAILYWQTQSTAA